MALDQKGVIGNSLRPEVVPTSMVPHLTPFSEGNDKSSEQSPGLTSVLDHFLAVAQEFKWK